VIFFLFYASHPSYRAGIFIFLIVFLVIGAISLFYFKSYRRESIIHFFLKKFNIKNTNGADTAMEVEKEIFQYFHPNKKLIWKGLGLSVLVEIVLWTRTYFLILFLGKSVSILLTVSVVAFSSLAIIAPIPAALGSHDAVQSFIFTALGLGAGTGAAFVMVIRGAELIMSLRKMG